MPNSEARLNRRYIEMQKLLIVYTNHFPSQEKYALTSRILNASYGMYELMIEAQYLFHKKTTLGNLSKRHEQLRMLVLLAHEFGYSDTQPKASPTRKPKPPDVISRYRKGSTR